VPRIYQQLMLMPLLYIKTKNNGEMPKQGMNKNEKNPIMKKMLLSSYV
jgi:hypothetical protein